ncbi:MAG TPA: carboxypeptidase M32 [Bacteroidia bacterium]|nr:carboxypeptidase M32 [Bacteroidia bacterium]
MTNMPRSNPAYHLYKQKLTQIADLNAAMAVLQWDQEVYMPAMGATLRAQQLATLSGMAHDLGVEKELGSLLEELSKSDSLNKIEKINVTETLRVYNDRKKYNTAFVIELSKTVSESFNAWQEAKRKKEFNLFLPFLSKLVDLKKKECDLLGYDEHPYDALLNQFEPGLKTKKVSAIFTQLHNQLIPVTKKIADASQPNTDFLHFHFDKNKQWDFSLILLKQLNYDFNKGRQDISTHPFTTGFNANDVRVTTRINENDLFEMIGSSIHECGHALYEQGLPVNDYGLPSGEFLSLAIHESQSRLWENNVGRSLSFWKCNFQTLKNTFPDQLKNISVQQFYAAINTVKPSFIRTNADELTYHLHIMIRFELERDLFEGKIDVADLKNEWNKKYNNYLGLKVEDDSQGILQDVHWSHGMFGYFPTYSLGSMYAAQFFAAAKNEIKNLEAEIESGSNLPLLSWLREKIHRHGKTFSADELCINIAGSELNIDFFMNYIREKYANLYSVNL